MDLTELSLSSVKYSSCVYSGGDAASGRDDLLDSPGKCLIGVEAWKVCWLFSMGKADMVSSV